MCGGGAAGVELSFACKERWTKVFGQEISVTLVSSYDNILPGQAKALQDEIRRKLQEKRIKLIKNNKVTKITDK